MASVRVMRSVCEGLVRAARESPVDRVARIGYRIREGQRSTKMSSDALKKLCEEITLRKNLSLRITHSDVILRP